jgi:hypothetical protein
MFLLRSEAAKSFQLVRESTRNNMSTVFWATGAIERQPQVLEFPIDSVTPRLTVTISLDTEGSRVSILTPAGVPISEASPNTEFTQLNCGRIATVVSPPAGNWRVELIGKGRFWVEAQAQSELHMVRAEFVTERGRPGHEGLFRIDGQPVIGKPTTIQVSMSRAGARSVEFHLAGERGETIQNVQTRPTDSAREEFVGTVDLPNVPFRIVMTGVDANGRQYQRFFPSLFNAESVEVSWNRTFDELTAGSSKRAEFTIRNFISARTFKLTVTDVKRFITNVEPKEVTLGPGQSATIVVDLTVPPGTQPGIGDDVVVVAASTAGPATSNSSVAHFSVVAPVLQKINFKPN